MPKRSALADAALLAAALLAPGASEAQWSYLGLGGRDVRTVRAREPYLYACTSDGLFQKTLGLSDTAWTPIGLQGQYLNDVLPVSAETLLAAQRLSLPGDTISLYRTTDGGATWEPFQNGFGAGGGPSVRALAALPLQPGVWLGAADPAFPAAIEKSSDSGLTWDAVFTQCTFNFLAVHPSSGTVWTGGESCALGPILVSSTDDGESWQYHSLPFPPFTENACDAIAFHPANPLVIFVGMETRVIRSTDGGASFQLVTSPSPALVYFGMAVGEGPPVRVYASGHSAPEAIPHVYRSEDLGQSWTALSDPSPDRLDFRNLLLLRRDGADTLYAGTSSGVYRFAEAPPVGVAAPPRDRDGVELLGRPNPFRDRATLDFVLPAAGPARLRVWNVHGVEVARLRDGVSPAGPHRVEWDARKLPSGLYICELATAHGSFTRKLLRVR